MITMDDLFEKDGSNYLTLGQTIINGNSYNPLKPTSSQRQVSYLYINGKLEEKIFDIKNTNNKLCLKLNDLKLIPVSCLNNTLKKQALSKIRLLAEAFQVIGKERLNLNKEILPLSRIYFTTEGGVLILPEEIHSFVYNLRPDNFNNLDFYYLINSEQPIHLRLELELVQLMYFAYSGVLPYSSEQSRSCNLNFIPLTFSEPNLKLTQFIDNSLKMKELPDNWKNWFLINTDSLDWKLPLNDPFNNLHTKNFIEKQNQKIKRMNFWKKKGPTILIILAVLIVVLSFVIHLIIVKTAPPKTAGLEPTAIISAYFEGQNNLDIEAVTDSFVRDKDCPIYQEVSTLYVTLKMREAYENNKTIITPEEWINEGKNSITSGNIIYGVSDIKLALTGPFTVEAKSTLWNSKSQSDDDLPNGQVYTSLTVELYRQDQQFNFVKKKDYYEIESVIDLKDPVLLETKDIPYTEASSPLVD